MAKVIKTKKGKEVVLLNPAEKAQKFIDELVNNTKITNDGHLKFDKNGKPVKLTQSERAFRSGYLASRKDSAKAYKSKHK